MSMTVKELIEKLRREDGDRIVVLSSDPEGNSKATLDSDFGHGYWLPEDEYVNADEDEDEYDPEGRQPALSLWPEW